jgi:hypothetical protein
MKPAGYLRKKIVPNIQSLNLGKGLIDICSLSSCISKNFTDYINYWQHNGYWLFDSPSVMSELASVHNISLKDTQLFYYEYSPEQYNAESKIWEPYEEEVSFPTNVLTPKNKKLLGYDIVSFTAQTSPECSPLSCNALSREHSVNSHCLFASYEEAMKALESGAFVDAEPGPYRIIAVYEVSEV